jgi:hypothetical protein
MVKSRQTTRKRHTGKRRVGKRHTGKRRVGKRHTGKRHTGKRSRMMRGGLQYTMEDAQTNSDNLQKFNQIYNRLTDKKDKVCGIDKDTSIIASPGGVLDQTKNINTILSNLQITLENLIKIVSSGCKYSPFSRCAIISSKNNKDKLIKLEYYRNLVDRAKCTLQFVKKFNELDEVDYSDHPKNALTFKNRAEIVFPNSKLQSHLNLIINKATAKATEKNTYVNNLETQPDDEGYYSARSSPETV